MKIRTGFVSNSSSSSFVLDKRRMTEEQVGAVCDHIRYAKEHFPGQFYVGEENYSAAWSITEGGSIITMWCSMDNFDMRKFLDWMRVPKEAILDED